MESASKVSPGPWTWAEENGLLDMPALLDADGKPVCDFGDSTQYYPSAGTPPNDDNRVLIAAAPVMLALLRRIWVARDEGWYEDNRGWGPIDSELNSLLDRLGRSEPKATP